MRKTILFLFSAVLILFLFTSCNRNISNVDAPKHEPGVEEHSEQAEQCYDDETITVRFYYHCKEIDPYMDLLPEAYLYILEEVSVKNLEEEFIRLMLEHTGITILGFWFDGSKLYVSLDPSELGHFDHGSTGSADRGTRLNSTLASFVQWGSFQVLVGGEPGVETYHFNFGYEAMVENGEIVNFDFYSLNTDPRIRIYEIYFDNRVPISRLLTEPFFPIMGEPLISGHHFYDFGGIQITGVWDYNTQSYTNAENVTGFVPNLHYFQILGETPNRVYHSVNAGDLVREHILNMFYNPIVVDNRILIKIENPMLNHVLDFWFSGDDYFYADARPSDIFIAPAEDWMLEKFSKTTGIRTYWQYGEDFIENARPSITFDHSSQTFEFEVNLYYRMATITGTFVYDADRRTYHCQPSHEDLIELAPDYTPENFRFTYFGADLIFYIDGTAGFIGATVTGDLFYSNY